MTLTTAALKESLTKSQIYLNIAMGVAMAMVCAAMLYAMLAPLPELPAARGHGGGIPTHDARPTSQDQQAASERSMNAMQSVLADRAGADRN